MGPAWQQILATMTARFSDPVLRQATAAMVNRSRYTEDRLHDGSFSQYVILPTPAFLDDIGLELVETVSRIAAERGEPFQAFLSPTEAETLVEQECDLRVSEHPTRDDLHNRYFAGRSDGLTPYTAQRLIAAAVPCRS